jgi:hypothetical protein
MNAAATSLSDSTPCRLTAVAPAPANTHNTAATSLVGLLQDIARSWGIETLPNSIWATLTVRHAHEA